MSRDGRAGVGWHEGRAGRGKTRPQPSQPMEKCRSPVRSLCLSPASLPPPCALPLHTLRAFFAQSPARPPPHPCTFYHHLPAALRATCFGRIPGLPRLCHPVLAPRNSVTHLSAHLSLSSSTFLPAAARATCFWTRAWTPLTTWTSWRRCTAACRCAAAGCTPTPSCPPPRSGTACLESRCGRGVC